MKTDSESMSALPSGPALARRRWLMGGAAAVAGLAGAGFAAWRYTPRTVEDGAIAAFWSLELQSPSGAAMAMKAFRGKPLLLNFWATWCPPCVEELPLLNSFYKENAANGWQVLGLAVDQAPAVRNFLGKLALDFPVAMAGLAGVDTSKTLGNLSGGLPFTVVFGADGTVLHRKMGQVKAEDLRIWRTLR